MVEGGTGTFSDETDSRDSSSCVRTELTTTENLNVDFVECGQTLQFLLYHVLTGVVGEETCSETFIGECHTTSTRSVTSTINQLNFINRTRNFRVNAMRTRADGTVVPLPIRETNATGRHVSVPVRVLYW